MRSLWQNAGEPEGETTQQDEPENDTTEDSLADDLTRIMTEDIRSYFHTAPSCHHCHTTPCICGTLSGGGLTNMTIHDSDSDSFNTIDSSDDGNSFFSVGKDYDDISSLHSSDIENFHFAELQANGNSALSDIEKAKILTEPAQATGWRPEEHNFLWGAPPKTAESSHSSPQAGCPLSVDYPRDASSSSDCREPMHIPAGALSIGLASAGASGPCTYPRKELNADTNQPSAGDPRAAACIRGGGMATDTNNRGDGNRHEANWASNTSFNTTTSEPEPIRLRPPTCPPSPSQTKRKTERKSLLPEPPPKNSTKNNKLRTTDKHHLHTSLPHQPKSAITALVTTKLHKLTSKHQEHRSTQTRLNN